MIFFFVFRFLKRRKLYPSFYIDITLELSQEFELRQKACWQFKWKIQQAMQSSKRYPINGIVHVDEFYIGAEEKGKRGRSKGDKKLVVIAVLYLILYIFKLMFTTRA